MLNLQDKMRIQNGLIQAHYKYCNDNNIELELHSLAKIVQLKYGTLRMRASTLGLGRINRTKNNSTTSNYRVDSKTGCWNWIVLDSRNRYGQARIKINGKWKSIGAHVLYYIQFKGIVPTEYEIDHLCNNPRCVNPEHLEAVPSVVNTRRRLDLKLDMEKAREIRRLNDKNPFKYNIVYLSVKFEVSSTMISNILNNKAWQEIE